MPGGTLKHFQVDWNRSQAATAARALAGAPAQARTFGSAAVSDKSLARPELRTIALTRIIPANATARPSLCEASLRGA